MEGYTGRKTSSPSTGGMMKGSSDRHKALAASQGPISVALLTVSDSRSKNTDINAQYLERQLQEAGHKLSEYRLIRDDPEEIVAALQGLARSPAQVILVNGGTGISKRDNTIDVLEGLLVKKLPGYGELFRSLSYRQIGSAAMLSRAIAGLYEECIIFSMPGSPNAVSLAWEELIRPELRHLAYEAAKE